MYQAFKDLCGESSMQGIPYDVSHVRIDYDESVNVKDVSNKIYRKDERGERSVQRAALERDVSQLQKKLLFEINMRSALSRGLSRPLGSLPRIYASLPVETRDLVLEVAVLEEEIVSLEKQITHLGREIEIGVMPVTDKGTIWQNPYQNMAPWKVEILDSLLDSPEDSARIKSKPSLSPGKSIDQKSNLSKPSLSAGKVMENKRSSVKTASIPSRNPVEYGSSLKSSLSPKDTSKANRTSTLVPPQKPQFQRSSSLPKAPLGNARDLKSRRLSLTKKEHRDFDLSPTLTAPFVPMKVSAPKEDEESTPPISPPLVSPSDVGKSCSQPSRIKTENEKPPMIRYARLGRKDLVSNKVAPIARIVKGPSTPRQPGQDKDLQLTSRLPRQPLAHETISTGRTMRPSTPALEQRMDAQGSFSAPNSKNTTFNSDSSHQESVEAEDDKDDTNDEDISVTDELDGDYKFAHVSPDNEKINQPSSTPERYSKLGLEKFADSVLLSEDVVNLLKTICGNMQERQPPLASDLDSSSQVSNSTHLSSASPDGYEIRGAGSINYRLKECYTGSFMSKRRLSMKYMRDCGEVVADALDPCSHLSRGNISNRTDFHQRLI